MAAAVSTLLLSSVAFIAIGYYFFFHLRRLRLYIANAKFPGPWPLPIIGNAHLFIGKTEDMLDRAINLLNNYPSPFRIWMAHRLFYVVYEPEHLKIVMNSPKTLAKDDMYSFTEPWVGTGLFTAPAEKWKVHRKIIAPTFNQRILDSFFDVFVKQAIVMVKELEKIVGGEEFDVFHAVLLCTMDTICETALGIPSKLQTDKDTSYVDSVKKLTELFISRIFKAWYHPDIVFYNSELGRETMTHLKTALDFTDQALKKKRELMATAKEAGVEAETLSENETLKMKPFLEYLIELTEEGTKFSEEELKEEVNSMIFAGSDTTASIVSSAILMLASHPEIQEKVYQELYEIYGSEDPESAPVKLQDLSRMEYLERVIKESMRLFPVGSLILRRTTDDLDLGEYTLSKGASVVLGIIKTHRSEKYWKDPLTFDPDRFSPEESAKRHPYTFVPFSGGPRNCLGIKYAMMSMKALLGTLMRAFVFKKDNITPVKDIKLKLDILLKPQVPITVRLESRVSSPKSR